MSPLENSTNLAARMGRWSARRRKTAIFGWLAFVAAAAVIGAMLGTKQLDPDDNAVGESKRAQEIIEAGGFVDSADESVLVASEAHTASELAFRAVLADVVPRGLGQRGRLGRPASARLGGPPRRARAVRALGRGRGGVDARGAGARAASQRCRSATRRSASRRSADASAQLALEETIAGDFTRAEYTAFPITLGILVVVFGALVAAGIPLLVGLSAVLAAIGLLAVPSRLFAMDEAANFVILLDRSRRQRRLLALLPQARAGGARRREGQGGRARGSRRDIRPGDPDLRPDGDRRRRRHVLRRLRDLDVGRRSARSSSSPSRWSARSLCCRRRSAGSATASRGAASRFCRAGGGTPSPASGEPSSTASCAGPPSRPPSPAGCWWLLAVPALFMRTADVRHRRAAAVARRSCRPTSASRSPSPAARCPRSSRSEPRT